MCHTPVRAGGRRRPRRPGVRAAPSSGRPTPPGPRRPARTSAPGPAVRFRTGGGGRPVRNPFRNTAVR